MIRLKIVSITFLLVFAAASAQSQSDSLALLLRGKWNLVSEKCSIHGKTEERDIRGKMQQFVFLENGDFHFTQIMNSVSYLSIGKWKTTGVKNQASVFDLHEITGNGQLSYFLDFYAITPDEFVLRYGAGDDGRCDYTWFYYRKQ